MPAPGHRTGGSPISVPIVIKQRTCCYHNGQSMGPPPPRMATFLTPQGAFQKLSLQGTYLFFTKKETLVMSETIDQLLYFKLTTKSTLKSLSKE
eukprot:scaffold11840_cov133-Isochrysis_galbana.AAC.1